MNYPRQLKDNLLSSFKASPITLLIGPRQSGKTTLMREIASEIQAHYITLDTLKQLAAAQNDPEGFVNALPRPVIIDEVQRVPQIALPLKLAVDQDRKPGSFGLTGSANPLVAPKLNDSLAGRMFILHLWPLSLAEIYNHPSDFLKKIFDTQAQFTEGAFWEKQEMVEVWMKGGYPDALRLEQGFSRDKWYDNLLTTILERDVQDLATISRPKDMAKLLEILALRTSNLLNLSEISRIASIPYTTLNHYMMLLESLFLIVRQPAWHLNRTKRLIKMPKIYFGDTGLLLNQLRIDSSSILENGRILGNILENFVFLELKKQASWVPESISLYHYRTQTGIEVDFVLENKAGQLVGIEVKASETLSPADWKGIDTLGEEMGQKMIRGIILYPGKEVVAFKKDRLAIPLSCLWS